MVNVMLSSAEEDTLKDLDRLIDWHKDNNKPLDHVVVSKKQYNALKRISMKKLDKTLFRRIGELEITATHYRGIELCLHEPARRSRRKKDNEDMFS